MKNFYRFTLLLVVVVLSSCASRKDTIYLQDMEDTREYPVIQKYESVIQRDDKLSIVVSAKNPSLALPFNIPGTGGYTVDAEGNINTTSGTVASKDDKPGYTVDINGEIDFPMLGKIYVEGMTRNQLTDYIKKRLVEEELLKDPIVMVNFLNFKISVLGEVGKVGTINVPGDRITILEAIAMAGDILPTGRMDRVAVVRDYGNKRRIIYVDLRTKDLFTSAAYYLRQNDLVIVEPTRQQADQENQRRFSYWQLGLSTVTTLVTLILYFCK